MRVLKFGGKSLSTKEKMQNICNFIKKIYKNDKKLIIIVSACGNETDELESLGIDFGGETYNRYEMAKLLSIGETKSSAIFSMLLLKNNMPAKSFGAYDLDIKSFGDPLDSKVYYINKSKLDNYLNKNIICVVAGFQALNSNNEICTLGRGGSDTTATAIASIYNVDAEIYSDFDGIFAGDPRILNFKKISKIDFNTTKLMAQYGSKVIAERATIIAQKNNIRILSKSAAKPNLAGSIISNLESDVICISCENHLCLISIIFSDNKKLKFIIKNVLFCLKNEKIYNLKYENNKISFLIKSEKQTLILNALSKKLKILKNQ